MWIQQYSIAILIWISTYLEETSGSEFDRYEKLLADYKHQNIIPIHYYDKKLYYFSVNNRATYLEADQFCRDIHMRLVYLDSEKELQHLHEYAKEKADGSSYWTAGSKLLDNKNYVWLTTADLVDKSYLNNPDEDNGQCLTLKQSDERLSFESKSCTDKYNFICKRQKSEPSVSCEDNVKRWSALFKNPLVGPNLNLLETTSKTYYIGTNSKLTYQQALQFCQIINMALVSVTSEKANDNLGKYIQSHNLGKKFWSSGTKSLDGTNWVWFTEGSPLDYTKWAPGEPATDDKNCLALEEEGGSIVWKSSACDTNLPFICQSTHQHKPNNPSELFKKFENLTSLTSYITDMHQYLQQVGFIVGSLMSPQSHFIPNPESERNNATVNHIDYKATEYITLLLEYLYDYVIKLSAILDNPEEKVKYKTTDIKKVVGSIENWLYTIRKLLHPNDTISENKKICDEDKDWEVCLQLLNGTIQEYALAIGLTYVPYDIYTGIPVGKFPGGYKLPPGSMLPNITGPDSLELFDATFSKIISTIFRPILVSLYSQNQSQIEDLPLIIPELPNPPEETTLAPTEETSPSEEPQTESGEDTIYKGLGRPKSYLPSRPLLPQLENGQPPVVNGTEENLYYVSPLPELLPNLEQVSGQPPVVTETEENPYYSSPRPEHLLPKLPLPPNLEEGQPPIAKEEDSYSSSPRPELIPPDRPPLPNLKEGQPPVVTETEENPYYSSPRPELVLPDRPPLPDLKEGQPPVAKEEDSYYGSPRPELILPDRPPFPILKEGQPPVANETEENPYYSSPRPELALPDRPPLPDLKEGQPPVVQGTGESLYYDSPRPELIPPDRPPLPDLKEEQPPVVDKTEENPYYGSPRPDLLLPGRPLLPNLGEEELPTVNETEGNQNMDGSRPDLFLRKRPLLPNVVGIIDAKTIGFEQNASGIFQPGLPFPNHPGHPTIAGVINAPGYTGGYSGQVQSFLSQKGGSQFTGPIGGQFGGQVGGQLLGSNYGLFNQSYGLGSVHVMQRTQMKIVEWTQDGRHFMQVSYKATPAIAANICKENGLELISLVDPRTNEIVTNYLSRAARGQAEFYWTSGQKQRYGNWRWGDGSPVTYTNWAFGQPDNLSGNEFCIRIDALGTWSDAPCDLEYNFMCGSPKERQVPPPQFIDVPKPFIQISFGSRSLKNKTEHTTSAPQ